jgi:hypothetical protein
MSSLPEEKIDELGGLDRLGALVGLQIEVVARSSRKRWWRCERVARSVSERWWRACRSRRRPGAAPGGGRRGRREAPYRFDCGGDSRDWGFYTAVSHSTVTDYGPRRNKLF